MVEIHYDDVLEVVEHEERESQDMGVRRTYKKRPTIKDI